MKMVALFECLPGRKIKLYPLSLIEVSQAGAVSLVKPGPKNIPPYQQFGQMAYAYFEDKFAGAKYAIVLNPSDYSILMVHTKIILHPKTRALIHIGRAKHGYQYSEGLMAPSTDFERVSEDVAAQFLVSIQKKMVEFRGRFHFSNKVWEAMGTNPENDRRHLIAYVIGQWVNIHHRISRYYAEGQDPGLAGIPFAELESILGILLGNESALYKELMAILKPFGPYIAKIERLKRLCFSPKHKNTLLGLPLTCGSVSGYFSHLISSMPKLPAMCQLFVVGSNQCDHEYVGIQLKNVFFYADPSTGHVWRKGETKPALAEHTRLIIGQPGLYKRHSFVTLQRCVQQNNYQPYLSVRERFKTAELPDDTAKTVKLYSVYCDKTLLLSSLAPQRPAVGRSSTHGAFAVKSTAGFSPGDEVVVVGLTKAVTLNGLEGIIEKFDEKTGRYVVNFSGATTKPKMIKPGNLEQLSCRVSSTPADL